MDNKWHEYLPTVKLNTDKFSILYSSKKGDTFQIKIDHPSQKDQKIVEPLYPFKSRLCHSYYFVHNQKRYTLFWFI